MLSQERRSEIIDAPVPLTKEDRFASLMALCERICGQAAAQEQLYEIARSRITAVLQEMDVMCSTPSDVNTAARLIGPLPHSDGSPEEGEEENEEEDLDMDPHSHAARGSGDDGDMVNGPSFPLLIFV